MQSAARAFEPAQQTGSIDSVWCSLEQAARGDHTAWALSNAMESVAAHCCAAEAERISVSQRDELLLAVVRAQLGAIKYLPDSYSREQIDAGMQALAGQVMLWAETPERTTRRRQHALTDLNAYARMFRNDLHNISLREEIERRAWERRNSQIHKLLFPFAGSKAEGI
jgi:hypothetical protein